MIVEKGLAFVEKLRDTDAVIVTSDNKLYNPGSTEKLCYNRRTFYSINSESLNSMMKMALARLGE